ncbi:Uncharacterised protein [Yersinia enterocolitica]|nr:Uncharacterised protein [Yersinia enterocolitica]
MGQPLGEMGGVACQIFVWSRFGEYDVVMMLQPIIGAMRPELSGFQVINPILKADQVARRLGHDRDLQLHRFNGIADTGR